MIADRGSSREAPNRSSWTFRASATNSTCREHLYAARTVRSDALHPSCVSEDAHQLYGFATESERKVFRQLLKISGIGARTALSVLSGLSVADLREAVSTQDAGRLTKVPGIGKKTAERLLLELRDKLDAVAVAPATARGDGQGADVTNALLALGYNDKEVSWAIRQLPAGLNVSDGIRQALRLLSKQ